MTVALFTPLAGILLPITLWTKLKWSVYEIALDFLLTFSKCFFLTPPPLFNYSFLTLFYFSLAVRLLCRLNLLYKTSLFSLAFWHLQLNLNSVRCPLSSFTVSLTVDFTEAFLTLFHPLTVEFHFPVYLRGNEHQPSHMVMAASSPRSKQFVQLCTVTGLVSHLGIHFLYDFTVISSLTTYSNSSTIRSLNSNGASFLMFSISRLFYAKLRERETELQLYAYMTKSLGSYDIVTSCYFSTLIFCWLLTSLLQ